MRASEQYQEIVTSLINDIRGSERPVVIFGAGRAGWYIMKVFEHYGVPITAFIDNDPEKQNVYDKHKVLPPKDITERYPDAHVSIGVFVPNTAIVIKEQLRQIGFQDPHYNVAAFLFMYFVAVAGRNCDKGILAESIRILFENYEEGSTHYGYTKDNYFISPFVTSVITQKCSLRCRDCAQFIPYYKNPANLPVESAINDLKQYAKAFDVVPEISLHGGEPFLHPHIVEICKEAAAIPNIVFISFVTNGTIMLSDDTLHELSRCGADVNQSGGYGSLSRKQDALFEAFQKHNIYSEIMFCSPTEMWTQIPPCNKRNRTNDANNEIYRKCVSTKTCCQIMDGELHRCALSMHGSHQGLFPKHDGDFVNLQEPNVSDSVLVDQIRAYLNRDQAFAVCDYCDLDGGVLVAPAIQLQKGSKLTQPSPKGKETNEQ